MYSPLEAGMSPKRAEQAKARNDEWAGATLQATVNHEPNKPTESVLLSRTLEVDPNVL